MVNEGILSAIGNTPLIKLNRLYADTPINLFAKLESFNPGGSLKDRPAHYIIEQALATGDLKAGMTVIESSSGNMAIGLAQVCLYHGIHFICVVDPKTTPTNLQILHTYGVQVDMVEKPDPVTGEYLQARINRVQALLQTIPGSIWTQQYANLNNPRGHYRTMNEIVTALDGKVDYMFCATSTCGTLRGVAEYVRDHNMSTKIYAVDALGSAIFARFGSPPIRRLVPGHGASRIPELFQPDLATDHIHVDDMDCIVGCRQLLRREAILAGGSSGAIVSAINKVKDTLPEGTNCVMIVCDRGERYLETIYSDAWVKQHFGMEQLPTIEVFQYA